uniref:Putative transposase (Putative), gypsy type n=1 Tax=Tanacetum cinerariifolium TaxID=118510 RepID=A0A6L2N1F9_TANCI|nr:putative transposase (putative), gypsy type [Tanacetum cinerariifolium]
MLFLECLVLALSASDNLISSLFLNKHLTLEVGQTNRRSVVVDNDFSLSVYLTCGSRCTYKTDAPQGEKLGIMKHFSESSCNCSDNSFISDGANRYGARATGAAPGINSIWNSTGHVGGRTSKSLGKTSGKRPGRNTPQCYTKPLDSLKNWNNRFFWIDERVFPTVVDWQTNAPKDGMSAAGTYSLEAVRVLDTHHMDLFNLIRALNPTKPATTDSSGVPSTIERSPLDFAHEAGASNQGAAAPEIPSSEDVPATVASGIRCPLLTLHHAIPLTLPRDPRSENASSLAEVGSPGSVYRPEWGITNGSLLDTPEACQYLVDHAAPPGYFFDLRYMHNEEFFGQYNINLARQVARRDQIIQARELEIKNLEARLETEAGMKKAAEDKSAVLIKELEHLRARFSDLQMGNEHLSQQVATLQEQVSGEEKLKAAFEEFKRYEDKRVEQRCAKLDARLDALSIDFDEELYLHMLTAIAGRRWVIWHGLRLAMMKCAESLEMRQTFIDVVSAGVAKGMSEGLKHGVEHGHAQLKVESIEAYDPEAEAKFFAAFQSLKDLKYPLLDQLEGLKDAPMDVIMAALYLKSDTGEDAPQYIRDLRPSSSQLAIPVSDGVPVSVPTVVPQGLALLLVDAATQTGFEDT